MRVRAQAVRSAVARRRTWIVGVRWLMQVERMKNADSAEPRRGTAPSVQWAGPSRRARVLAAALAIGLAALSAVIVSLAWKRVPLPRAQRPSVEVQLIAAPAPGLAHPPPVSAAASTPR